MPTRAPAPPPGFASGHHGAADAGTWAQYDLSGLRSFLGEEVAAQIPKLNHTPNLCFDIDALLSPSAHASSLEANPASQFFHRALTQGTKCPVVDPNQFANHWKEPWPLSDECLLLPLSRSESLQQITLVTSVPLLLPSTKWLQRLAAFFPNYRYAIAVCPPEAFSRYRQVLRNKCITGATPAVPNPRSPEQTPLQLVNSAFCDLHGFSLDASGLRQHFSSFDAFSSLTAVPVYLYGDILTVAYPVPAQRASFRMTDETRLMTLLPKALATQNKRFRLKLIQAEGEAIQTILATATTIDISALAGSLEESQGGYSVKREVHAFEAQALADKAYSGDASMADVALSIIYEAVKAGASDIHIQPEQNELVIRYRVNGRCYKFTHTIPVFLCSQLIGAIKAKAKINHVTTPIPQDGGFSLQNKQGGDVIDVRVNTQLTEEGESSVMRLSRQRQRLLRIEDLGLSTFGAHILKRFIDSDHGLGLVCGPTGSGKSTTLYAAMADINREIYTVLSGEAPVERRIPGVAQTTVRHPLTFSDWVKGCLRRDPDYIIVGETRDEDTAEQIVRAAETGHVTFTTLHTNTAAGAITRLNGLGIPRFIIAEVLKCVFAQRLAGVICPDCAVPAKNAPSREEMLDHYKIRPDDLPAQIQFFNVEKRSGCPRCKGTGIVGRTLICEAFYVDHTVKELILTDAPLHEIEDALMRQGGQTLGQAALLKSAAGTVPLSEAIGIVGLDALAYVKASGSSGKSQGSEEAEVAGDYKADYEAGDVLTENPA
ncbi:MAG: type II/IV secretion system protein [Verrucomicrobia bacterium]|nr:type II/IV secretion system protein [Verrucomicrobiota bacterium]